MTNPRLPDEKTARRVTIQKATDTSGSGISTWIVQQPADDLQGTHALIPWEEWEIATENVKQFSVKNNTLEFGIKKLLAWIREDHITGLNKVAEWEEELTNV